MARDLSVYRSQDLDFIRTPPCEDPNRPEWEEWAQECSSRTPYTESFASESAARVYWSEPASRLGLPLLASIYDRGFYEGLIWSGETLHQLLFEIERLQHAWLATALSHESQAAAEEQAIILRRAALIAIQNNAVVLLT